MRYAIVKCLEDEDDFSMFPSGKSGGKPHSKQPKRFLYFA